MTYPKPLVVNRAQLLKDVEWYEIDARVTRRLLTEISVPDVVRQDNEDEAARHERAAQVLRAVAEGDARYRIPGNPFMFTAPASTDSEPVLIITATISPEEGT